MNAARRGSIDRECFRAFSGNERPPPFARVCVFLGRWRRFSAQPWPRTPTAPDSSTSRSTRLSCTACFERRTWMSVRWTAFRQTATPTTRLGRPYPTDKQKACILVPAAISPERSAFPRVQIMSRSRASRDGFTFQLRENYRGKGVSMMLFCASTPLGQQCTSTIGLVLVLSRCAVCTQQDAA